MCILISYFTLFCFKTLVQISQANLRNDELNKTVAALELKLQRQSDYDSIKKDLSILKTMEFSQNQDDTDEGKFCRPIFEMLVNFTISKANFIFRF